MRTRRSWLRLNGAYRSRSSADGPRTVAADHDAVRAHAVVDGIAFLQELGLDTTSNAMSAPRAG